MSHETDLILSFFTFDRALVLLPDEDRVLLVLGFDVGQVVNPEISAERDPLQTSLEDLHAGLLGALALLKVGILFPVAVAVGILVEESIVCLSTLRKRKYQK